MRFDDRLATVLRQTATGDAIARIQYRQLIDLLGTSPVDAHGAQFDAACLRLAELSEAIPAPERARIVGDPTLRLRNPRLLASLAESEPSVASAAMAAARLDEDQWLDLIPALPVAARGFVRNRRDLGTRVEGLLGRLGIADRGLPPLADETPLELDTPLESEPVAVPEPVPEPEPEHEPIAAAGTSAFGPGRSAAIGAIVRRIDEFRKARQLEAAQAPASDGVAPRLPLGDQAEFTGAREANSFDFASDREGRIVHCDRRFAPMAVGLRLAAQGATGGVLASPSLIRDHARRLPLRGEIVRIDGAPAIAGLWQLDASPRFARAGGAFTGYAGRLRRLDEAELQGAAAAAGDDSPSDRMRQVLHELRTPINAIQGFAEVIQQQLFGPTPHEYRALAASIASDAAHILAGFEDVERLVKLGANAVTLDPGECDAAAVIDRLARQISAHVEARGSGFTLTAPLPASAVVAVAESETERLVWRLLATCASACAAGERLALECTSDGDNVRLELALPAILAARDDEALFQSGPAAQTQALSPGMFGSGFALRLAMAEARAAGGALARRESALTLELPLAGRNTTINATERKAVH